MQLRPLLAAALLAAAAADTPNHCLYSQTVGTWTFYLSAAHGDNTIVCPTSTADLDVERTVTITLGEPDVATAGAGEPGWWSMVYDEGFHVHLKTDGESAAEQYFFAYQNWTTIANGTTVSNCSLTNVGFFHDAPAEPGATPLNWGCYFAEQVVESGASHNVNVMPPVARPRIPAGLRVKADPAFAAAINAEQRLWTASPKSVFHGMLASDAVKKAGQFVFNHPDTVKPRVAAHHKQSLSAGEKASLPEGWDWRNVQNVSYVCPVRNQGQCGSCYSFGSTSALCSRTAIALGAQAANLSTLFWSPQTVVSCSPYSQGCDGGFGYNVYKFAEDFGIPWDTCFPYTSGADGSVPPCYAKCNDTRQYNRITDNKFVGGFYGGATAELIQQEIFESGPVTVEMFVYPDFQHYTGGIYVHSAAAEAVAAGDAVGVNPWVATNHEVFLLGWGVEGKTPYWIGQNSWGTGFGENGFFRILRGVDEVSIESIPAAATPVLAPGAVELYRSLTSA